MKTQFRYILLFVSIIFFPPIGCVSIPINSTQPQDLKLFISNNETKPKIEICVAGSFLDFSKDDFEKAVERVIRDTQIFDFKFCNSYDNSTESYDYYIGLALLYDEPPEGLLRNPGVWPSFVSYGLLPYALKYDLYIEGSLFYKKNKIYSYTVRSSYLMTYYYTEIRSKIPKENSLIQNLVKDIFYNLIINSDLKDSY